MRARFRPSANVRRQIAAYLVAAGQTGVRIGGRDAGRAAAVAGQLGCEWAIVDLDDPARWDAALAGIGTVVVCSDIASVDFPAHVLRHGLAYIDISATDAVLRRIEAQHELALSKGGCAVLSVGLAPGLSNLMARSAVAGMERIEAVTIAVLLGLGDAHGPAAVNWTLDNLHPLAPGAVQMLGFGPQAKPVATIPFAFAHQHVLARRHAMAMVTTRLGLDSPLISRLSLRLLARLGPSGWFRQLLHWSMTRFRLGSDRASLLVEAAGQGPDRPLHRRLKFDGRAEATITALVAARVALMLPGARRPGVWHIDEIWDLADFAPVLREAGFSLEIQSGDSLKHARGLTARAGAG